MVAKTGEAYVAPNTSSSLISGNNNLFFGSGGATPAQFTTNFPVDPGFANLPIADFHLIPGSLAKGAGVNTGITHDFDGNPRSGVAFDLGAYQAVSTTPRPNPPTGVHVLAH